MSKDILEYEMNNGIVFDSVEKKSRSEIVDLLTNARECVFTVNFHKKLDEKYVKSTLDSTPNTVLSNNK